MGALTDSNVTVVHHYAPLHYLPFIARSGALLGKPSLAEQGFPPTHLRSMSSRQDIARGFGKYAFLTLDGSARILKAKLDAGFPHIGVRIPASVVDAYTYSVCRYNVAMTRYLRRAGSPGFPESETNGRYYDQQQIPVARTDHDKRALLKKHLGIGTMIEVLVEGDINLPDETEIVCFSDSDVAIAQKVVNHIGRSWTVMLAAPPGPYNRRQEYAQAVDAYTERALLDPLWRGNGLEFDRV